MDLDSEFTFHTELPNYALETFREVFRLERKGKAGFVLRSKKLDYTGKDEVERQLESILGDDLRTT